MFKAPTTIVLGAGASHSYGYPIGDDLISDLITLCSEKLENDTDHQYLDFPSLARLQRSLLFYDPISIDAFLTHYSSDKTLIDTAKKLISESLIKKNNSDLFRRGATLSNVLHGGSEDKSHWYRFLWDAIVSESSARELADIDARLNFEIITFNYDNSLEYFLLNAIYAKDSMFNFDERANFAEKILDKIHHVYGSLQDPYQADSHGKAPRISYYDDSSPIVRDKVEKSYRNIRLIHEREESDYQHLQDLIRSKSQVIFLGFGFDDTNIGPAVLNLRETLKARPTHSGAEHEYYPLIKYTNYENSELINRKLNRILYQKVNEDDSRWTRRKVGVGVIKSEKKVYQALAEDFRLNDF